MPDVIDRGDYTEIVGQSGEGTFGLQGYTSNVLVDQTASGCGLREYITSSGTWQNIGIKGRADVTGNQYQFAFGSSADITLDTLYLPGASDNSDWMGMYAASGFEGVVTIRNTYTQQYSDNGMYLDGPAGDGNGEAHIENCYGYNNNVCAYRIGTHGSYVRNSVSVRDGSDYIPGNASGAVNARAFFSVYGGQSVEIEGCDFAHSGATCFAANGASANVTDTQYTGGVGGAVNFVSGNGNNPDTSIPSGVPTSPMEAATGSPSGGGQATPPSEAVNLGSENQITFSTE